LLAACSEGATRLSDPNPGLDCRATLSAVEALGVPVRREDTVWILEGRPRELREPESVLDLGNSGTGIRLLCGLLAARPFFSVLTGDESLRRRPMGRVIAPLRAMGANIRSREGERAPLAVGGGSLRGIDYTLPMASAQVKSALLLAGLGLSSGEVRLREPMVSRDHTERLLQWLGAPLRIEEGEVRLTAGARLTARDWSVPGDISAAMFFLTAAVISRGSEVTVEGVGLNPTRTGALDVLARMGARLEIASDAAAGPEPVGSVTARSGVLHGTTVTAEEVPRMIDEVPVLAVAAACALGVTRFEGVKELRYKESDRIRSTCEMLRTLGVEVDEEAEAFTVAGRGSLRGGRVRSHEDHRISMAALVAGCAAEDSVEVDSVRMVATSDPGFLDSLARLKRGRG
jgi:3-phosphoshikimate 1-carboxyvinyltransferase